MQRGTRPPAPSAPRCAAGLPSRLRRPDRPRRARARPQALGLRERGIDAALLLATDINPEAVDATEETLREHGVVGGALGHRAAAGRRARVDRAHPVVVRPRARRLAEVVNARFLDGLEARLLGRVDILVRPDRRAQLPAWKYRNLLLHKYHTHTE